MIRHGVPRDAEQPRARRRLGGVVPFEGPERLHEDDRRHVLGRLASGHAKAYVAEYGAFVLDVPRLEIARQRSLAALCPSGGALLGYISLGLHYPRIRRRHRRVTAQLPL